MLPLNIKWLAKASTSSQAIAANFLKILSYLFNVSNVLCDFIGVIGKYGCAA
jgi:hypothetical protein